MVYHNATLEYALNNVTLWLFDDNGAEVPFAGDTTFTIQRVDSPSISYTVGIAESEGNKVVFTVVPPSYLKSEGDSLYDFDNPCYNHIFSVKSPTAGVYISGKMNLLEVA